MPRSRPKVNQHLWSRLATEFFKATQTMQTHSQGWAMLFPCLATQCHQLTWMSSTGGLREGQKGRPRPPQIPSVAICVWSILGDLCTLKVDKALLVPLNRTHLSSPSLFPLHHQQHKYLHVFSGVIFFILLAPESQLKRDRVKATYLFQNHLLKYVNSVHCSDPNTPATCNWQFLFYVP